MTSDAMQISPVGDEVAVPTTVDVRRFVERLRVRLGTKGTLEDVTRTMDAICDDVDRILVEHEGMADEILAVYEQLGIVFEVTRGLPYIRNETEVLDLILESLRKSFADYELSLVRMTHGGHWIEHGTEVVLHKWVAERVDRARVEPVVAVEKLPPGTWHGDVEEMMFAPVLSGEGLICTILVARKRRSPAFRASDMNLIESLSRFCGDIIRNIRLLKEVRETSVGMVYSLVNAVDQKDQYTSGHSVRVAYYATLLGKELHLIEHEMQMLQWSALLHDVGKIGIRDDVLKKEGKLTEDEFRHMREHPERSYNVVKAVPQLKGALDGVLHHHERFDGSGYPAGLARQEIPFQARILLLADIFDALTSNRSYRSAFSWQKALDIMQKEAGTVSDPSLQRIFDPMMRSRLKKSPDAWDRLFERATQFGEDWYAAGGRMEPTE